LAGAFVAVANDATATWWNPAGIAVTYFSLIGDRTQLSEPSDDPGTGPASRNKTTAFAAAFPALGLSYYRLRISEIAPQLTTADGLPGRQDLGATGVGLGSLVTHQFGATVGQSLGDHLVIASSMRLVRAGRTEVTAPNGGSLDNADELDVELESSGDLDVGALAMLGPARVGFSVKHVNEPDFGDGASRFVLKRQARAGVSWVIGQAGAAASLTAAFDAGLTRTATNLGDVRHVAAGAELTLPRQQLALRGGISANTIGELNRRATSGGISISVSRGMFLDAAATFGSDLTRKGWAVGLRLTI
jgi:hypothetical protein